MSEEKIVGEFLVESRENLMRLDGELIQLEKCPKDAAPLESIFHTMRTIQGSCGLLAFPALGEVAHEAENLLGRVLDGERELSAPLASLLREVVDAARRVLASIEACGEEGPERFEDLIERLRAAARFTAAVANQRQSSGPELWGENAYARSRCNS